jgi:hypothetical protein
MRSASTRRDRRSVIGRRSADGAHGGRDSNEQRHDSALLEARGAPLVDEKRAQQDDTEDELQVSSSVGLLALWSFSPSSFLCRKRRACTVSARSAGIAAWAPFRSELPLDPCLPCGHACTGVPPEASEGVRLGALRRFSPSAGAPAGPLCDPRALSRLSHPAVSLSASVLGLAVSVNAKSMNAVCGPSGTVQRRKNRQTEGPSVRRCTLCSVLSACVSIWLSVCLSRCTPYLGSSVTVSLTSP